MTINIFLHTLFRFVHIASVILLLGGLVYARQVVTPMLNALPEGVRAEAAAAGQARFRALLYVLLVLIVGSGLYNYFTYPGMYSRTYHMWFGIKMLLVAHLISAAILWATSPFGDVTVAGKSKRRLLSITISGVLIVAISAYLRSLHSF